MLLPCRANKMHFGEILVPCLPSLENIKATFVLRTIGRQERSLKELTLKREENGGNSRLRAKGGFQTARE